MLVWQVIVMLEDIMNTDKYHQFNSFEEFKEKVEELNVGVPDYMDMSDNEFKSKATLASLIDGQHNNYLNTLIGSISIIDYANLHQQFFWSNIAGDLSDSDAEKLLQEIKNYENKHGRVSNPAIIIFALKNNVAWNEYSDGLMRRINKLTLLKALSYVYNIDDKFIPLMNKKFGEVFTNAYIKHKDIIDKSPKKHNFMKLVKLNDNIIANFLDEYTIQLESLTSDFEEDPDDYYCLSNALPKEGFRDAAKELLSKMLANKELYINRKENYHDNAFIRDNFPDLVELAEKELKQEITLQDITDISIRCFKEAKIAKQIRETDELKEVFPPLLHDIIEALPDNIDQVKKCIELFDKLNERPETYGSSYNTYYPKDIIPLIKKDIPEWMIPVIIHARNTGVVSFERLGSNENLFDAAKTWKINPKIWKKEAEAIGKMSLPARIVAGSVFETITSQTKHLDRKQQKEIFWLEMKKAQDMGWKQSISRYCQDNAETRGRILSFYHPNMDEDLQKALRSCIHIKDLIDIDVEQLNKNIQLLEDVFGIEKREILGDYQTDNENAHPNKALLKRIATLDKIFGSNELKQKYLTCAAKQGNVNEAILALPYGLSDEKYKSLSMFWQNNLFYKDINGDEIMRPQEQIKEVCKVWTYLNKQQEQAFFSKVLGISYTYDSVNKIEQDFVTIKTSSELDIPDNLRLYQKLLINLSNREQEDVDNILSLNRDEGLTRISTIIEDNYTTDYYGRKALVDLIIGNDAEINKFERQQIAQLPTSSILNIKSKNYKDIVNDIMNVLTLDPKAGELFRKHYLDIVSDKTNYSDPKILKIREDYQANKDWIVPSAINTMLCFGNDYKRYLNKILQYNLYVKKEIAQNNPNLSQNDILNIHDALYWLPNDLTENNRASFMELIDKHLFYTDDHGTKKHRDLANFEIIAKSWQYLSNEERKSDYKSLLAIIRSKKYKDAKHLKFAEEAAHWGIAESSYKNLEKIYEQGLQVPELIDPTKRFKSENLTGRFLPRDDPRIGFFGQHTNCCQHFSGAGRSCAVSSIRDPFSQLFVVEDEKGRIVAGSWVWESKIKKGDDYYKALCFDNIEAIGDYASSQKVIDVYKKTLPYLAEQNYAKVTVGMGYQDGKVEEFANEPDPIPMNKSYSGYTDAHSQRLMLDNPNATPVDYSQGDIYITGALEEDLPSMQKISEICFPAGDRQLQVPSEDAQGLLLKDKGKVVGYVIWSEKEHSIYDMAVLPEYRKDKNASSLKLLNEAVKKIRAIGGEWSAELRDNTSLRYMKAMAGRGLVDLKVGDIDHEMSDGTKVYQVKFTPKEAPTNKQNVRTPTRDGR